MTMIVGGDISFNEVARDMTILAYQQEPRIILMVNKHRSFPIFDPQQQNEFEPFVLLNQALHVELDRRIAFYKILAIEGKRSKYVPKVQATHGIPPLSLSPLASNRNTFSTT